ncbi:MAG TPA: glycoside hydrolase family 15 protein [Kofleriaceae bacterium]|nr:glycoside hydrolase family 15 protein [Kofleriaceae bacterium]
MCVLGALLLSASAVHAGEPVESFDYLVTGNGHGFQVFDRNANAVKQFLERPYRFMRPNPANPDGEGIVRRNLSYDSYFGVRVGGQAAWLGERSPTQVGYVEQTNVIRSAVTVNGVLTESYFVAPYGYAGNAMVMLLKVTNNSSAATTVDAFALANFHMGSAPSPDTPQANDESIQWSAANGAAVETGPGGGALVYLPLGGTDIASCATDAWSAVKAGQSITPVASCSGDDRVQVFQKSLGSLAAGASAWWGVAVLFDADAQADAARAAFTTFLDGAGPEALLSRVLGEWDAWRRPVAPGATATEARIWRQSEAVLRMGQTLEPWSASPKRKNHGMVLAALPPGGWHTGWVRDAVYAIVAMARTGHYQEAKWALNFFLDAEAGKYKSYLNDVDYRITTVRYFGNGEEEADYSGHPTRNIEIDGWGLFLWAARTYVDASGDVAWLSEQTQYGETVYDVIRDEVAEALAANMEPSGMAIADASIWEVHWGNRQHFLYTTASAARGFCDMAALSRRLGEDSDRARYAKISEDAVTAMRTHFVDQSGVLAGSLERLASGSYRDGAVVEAFTWDLIPATDNIGTATLNDFSYLQTPAGGYKRIEGSTDQYDTDEWILIDLRASEAWRRAGNAGKANELLGWVTSQANVNFDLIPELYNTRSQSGAIGAYAGAIPMVGYGAGAYMLTLLHRAGINAPTDCGTVESYPDAGPGGWVDAGPEVDGGNGFGADGRGGVACACSGGGDPAERGGVLLLAVLTALLLRRRARRIV